MKTVIDLLDNAVDKWANNICYECENEHVTFSQLQKKSKQIATEIAKHNIVNEPIIVIATRSVFAPTVFFGVLYSGNYYVPIGDDTPNEKIKLIIDMVKPKIIITHGIETPPTFDGTTINVDNCNEINEQIIQNHREQIVDTDPQMMILTSGSSGTPKGVVTSHRASMELLESMVENYGINQKTIIGGQSPFYYSAHRRDLYLPIYCGCKLVIIPKQMFSAVSLLVDYLNDKKVNFIQWTTSVFSLIAGFNAFEKTPKYLDTVIFMGEPMKNNVFKYLLEKLPNVKLYNSYGLTELPDSLLNHKIDRNRNYSNGVPLGCVVKNRKVILARENNLVTEPNVIGEIYASGTAMAIGYYNDQQKTAQVFVQNPLNNEYPEIMLRTGDLGSYNEYGEIMFHGRADNCIKHMGHRIELGEIESAVAKCQNVKECVCLYDNEKSIITLWFTGDTSEKDLLIELRGKLPPHMIPRKTYAISEIMRMFNGKTDVQYYKNKLKGETKQ